jgi:hypothetical protein
MRAMAWRIFASPTRALADRIVAEPAATLCAAATGGAPLTIMPDQQQSGRLGSGRPMAVRVGAFGMRLASGGRFFCAGDAPRKRAMGQAGVQLR